jgi:integrase
MKAKITKRLVDAFRAEPVDCTVFDTVDLGFVLRVRKTGGVSYAVEYKAARGRGAPTKRVTIGHVGKMTPEVARAEAKKVLGSVAHGEDPAAEKTRQRRSLSLSEVIEIFLAQHAEAKRKASTAAWMRDALERIVEPALGSMKLDAVTRPAVARLHSSMSDRQVQANRTLAILSALYSWAGKSGYAAEGYNPARGVEKFPESGRERFLTRGELSRLGDALRQAETAGLPYAVDETKPGAKHAADPSKRRTKLDPFAVAAIRLLIFTGARLREILHAKWEHVDFERGVILLPDSKTGKKTIYLSAAALEILAGLPRLVGNPYVFPGGVEGKPRADLKKPWASVAKAAGLDGVRIHDLRHSFASFGAGASMGLPIIGKLLGHSQPATTARYAHLDADPMHRAVETIGATIGAALNGVESGDVTPIPVRRGR